MPTSTTATSTGGVGEGRECEHGERLEERDLPVASGLELGVDDRERVLELGPRLGEGGGSIGEPSSWKRSVKSTRCGLVKSPVRSPWARSSDSIARLVDVLPLRAGDLDHRVGQLG